MKNMIRVGCIISIKYVKRSTDRPSVSICLSCFLRYQARTLEMHGKNSSRGVVSCWRTSSGKSMRRIRTWKVVNGKEGEQRHHHRRKNRNQNRRQHREGKNLKNWRYKYTIKYKWTIPMVGQNPDEVGIKFEFYANLFFWRIWTLPHNRNWAYDSNHTVLDDVS